MAAHLHILGICGTFMGGLAAIAREAGYRVTGCDANVYPPMSEQLRALGIELIEGYGAEQMALAPDAWVVGNFEAIRQGAPSEIQQHIPAVQWFAVSINVNGGLNGVLRADARDEKAGEELRAVVNGVLAAGRLVSGQDKRIEAMLNGVQVTGAGVSPNRR